MNSSNQDSGLYEPPLLTRHEPLRGLTGKSGEKDPGEKDPGEKDPMEKDPNEKTFEGYP
jgi:hypothetical protein